MALAYFNGFKICDIAAHFGKGQTILFRKNTTLPYSLMNKKHNCIKVVNQAGF